eukprot:Rhum_TRINITY_DN15328_c10_g3::Rhum_TRINITY_DN15328_c10_g3_i5::g.152977::m.152977
MHNKLLHHLHVRLIEPDGVRRLRRAPHPPPKVAVRRQRRRCPEPHVVASVVRRSQRQHRRTSGRADLSPLVLKHVALQRHFEAGARGGVLLKRVKRPRQHRRPEEALRDVGTRQGRRQQRRRVQNLLLRLKDLPRAVAVHSFHGQRAQEACEKQVVQRAPLALAKGGVHTPAQQRQVDARRTRRRTTAPVVAQRAGQAGDGGGQHPEHHGARDPCLRVTHAGHGTQPAQRRFGDKRLQTRDAAPACAAGNKRHDGAHELDRPAAPVEHALRVPRRGVCVVGGQPVDGEVARERRTPLLGARALAQPGQRGRKQVAQLRCAGRLPPVRRRQKLGHKEQPRFLRCASLRVKHNPQRLQKPVAAPLGSDCGCEGLVAVRHGRHSFLDRPQERTRSLVVVFHVCREALLLLLLLCGAKRRGDAPRRHTVPRTRLDDATQARHHTDCDRVRQQRVRDVPLRPLRRLCLRGGGEATNPVRRTAADSGDVLDRRAHACNHVGPTRKVHVHKQTRLQVGLSIV